MEKINKPKNWFFQKINKMDKPVATLISKKETKFANIRNESGNITTDSRDIKWVGRL